MMEKIFKIDSDGHGAEMSGFTLIELLVAMGLFLTVVTIGSGAFVQILRTERAATELIALNDTASLVLEQISREIRMGSLFSALNSDRLNFTNAASKEVAYRFNAATQSIERSFAGGSFEAFTPSDMRVRRFNFITSGLVAGDALQPRITIAFSLSSRAKLLEDFIINVQTTVSPRNLEG